MIENDNYHKEIEWDVYKGSSSDKIIVAKKRNGIIGKFHVGDKSIFIKKIIKKKENFNEIRNLELINNEIKDHQILIKYNLEFYGYGVDENYIYIYNEYFDGCSIKDLKNKKHLFNEIQICKILKSTLEYLSFLHQVCNLIYMDLSCNNIMLKILSDGGVVIKFIDFGLSNHVGKVIDNFMGTYFPKEYEWFSVGRKIICNEFLDVWCLGCIGLELLGVKLYRCFKPFEIISKLQSSNLLKNFISKCLIENPSYRLDIKLLKKHPFIHKFKNRSNFNNIVDEYYKELIEFPFTNLKKLYHEKVIETNDIVNFITNKNLIGCKLKSSNIKFDQIPQSKNIVYLSIMGMNEITEEEILNYYPESLKYIIFDGKIKDIIISSFTNFIELKYLILNNYNNIIDLPSVPDKVSFLQLGKYEDLSVISTFKDLPNSIIDFSFSCEEDLISRIEREYIPSNVSFLYINNKLYEFNQNNILTQINK